MPTPKKAAAPKKAAKKSEAAKSADKKPFTAEQKKEIEKIVSEITKNMGEPIEKENRKPAKLVLLSEIPGFHR